VCGAAGLVLGVGLAARTFERRSGRQRQAAVRRHGTGFTADDVAAIRRSPESVSTWFTRHRAGFAARLSGVVPGLDEPELRYAYCSVLAHAMAPWGPSTATAFPDLLHERYLNCSNYGLLAVHLADACDADPQRSRRVRFVGWEGGAIGNHQMLFLDRVSRDGSLLLDPTLGLVARADFDDVAAGVPASPRAMTLFTDRDDVKSLREAVIGALCEGRFRPSDLLYYFDGVEHLVRGFGEARRWPTPGACDWRSRVDGSATG
jgi:hypothetical protein